MTTLRVRQIKTKLLNLFEAHLDKSGIPRNDEQSESKILSRCLAAFAIYHLSGCSETEAAQSVWDGSDDNGIDAAFYDASESRVIVVQSKWFHAGSGEPEAKDIATFANGIKDLVEQEVANFHVRLQAKIADISQAIMTPGTTVHIVLISTGANTISRHGSAALERIMAELNGTEEEALATNEVIGLSEIYPALASNTSNEKITIDATILDWSFIRQPFAAYFGMIDGLQLKQWWTAYGKRLVTKNIRHALGATDVNSRIRQTATATPEHFWYFNNGITLIADEAPRAPAAAGSRSSGNFQLRGASVVNGAQTVSTLGRIEDDTALGRVRVPIRVILLGDAPEGFGGDVTRTNNLQNRVEARDFVGDDPVQARLQMEMGMEGVEYQFLRSDDFISSPSSCDLVEATTALACSSGNSAHAVAIKTGIGRFFLDLSKAPYKSIFNANTSGVRTFNSILVLRSIDEWIDGKKKAAPKKAGYSWGVLIHGNRILSAGVFKLLETADLSMPIIDFRKTLHALDVPAKCDLIYGLMVSELEENYAGKFLAVLFKNPAMSKDILDRATDHKPSSKKSSKQVSQS